MDWKIDNLTPEQERAIKQTGYVGAFWKVLLPRLLATEPPKNEPVMTVSVMPQAPVEPQSVNTYVPLAHRW